MIGYYRALAEHQHVVIFEMISTLFYKLLYCLWDIYRGFIARKCHKSERKRKNGFLPTADAKNEATKNSIGVKRKMKVFALIIFRRERKKRLDEFDRLNEWMNEWMDGWMDECKETQGYLLFLHSIPSSPRIPGHSTITCASNQSYGDERLHEEK